MSGGKFGYLADEVFWEAGEAGRSRRASESSVCLAASRTPLTLARACESKRSANGNEGESDERTWQQLPERAQVVLELSKRNGPHVLIPLAARKVAYRTYPQLEGGAYSPR